MSRPRIALIMTTWHEDSHADVVAPRLIAGYDWDGEMIEPRVEVVSAYLEHRHGITRPRVRPDIGVDFLADHGIPLYPTPAEALGAGSAGVNVDGVVVIGEHGDYEDNEYGQKLYPRRRLIDSCLSAMIAVDRFVPIFNDKHLAWNFTDAQAIYDNARRLGVPLLAGSSIPLCWRKPQGTEWPYGAPMTSAIAVGCGGFESYGFHTLESLQAFTERRAGGESGAVEVRGFLDDQVAEAVATLDPGLLRTAVAAHGIAESEIDATIDKINAVFTITHADGLTSAMVNSPVLSCWSVAATGPDGTVSAELHREGAPHSHFIFLARAAETLFLTGAAPYPVERTLFTGGVLDHAIRNARGAVEPASPELSIAYTVPEHIPETGVPLKPYEHRS